MISIVFGALTLVILNGMMPVITSSTLTLYDANVSSDTITLANLIPFVFVIVIIMGMFIEASPREN